MTTYTAPGSVTYSYAQIEGIWTQAGGQLGAAPIAAAIAMAESGGNTNATNQDSNGTVDRGLWQINSVHGAQSTYDVMGNARAAVAISNNGTNWTPWTTFNSGAYRQYLQTNVAPDTSAPINATNAAANQSAGTLTGANTGPLPGGLWDPGNWFLNPLGSISGAAGGAASGVGDTLVKFAIQGVIVTMLNPLIQIVAGVMGMAAGGAMVIIGLWTMARQTQTGQQVERGAGAAAQVGMSAVAPEASATTRYFSGSQQTAAVTQTRRPAGAVRIGGQRLQYRPGTVRTDVQRTPNTQGTLRNEANQYQNRNGNGQGPSRNGQTPRPVPNDSGRPIS